MLCAYIVSVWGPNSLRETPETACRTTQATTYVILRLFELRLAQGYDTYPYSPQSSWYVFPPSPVSAPSTSNTVVLRQLVDSIVHQVKMKAAIIFCLALCTAMGLCAPTLQTRQISVTGTEDANVGVSAFVSLHIPHLRL